MSKSKQRRPRTIVSFTVLLAVLGMSAAFAQLLPAALDACTRIASDKARLQCFDREAAALSQHDGSSQQRNQRAADAPAAVPAPPQLTPEQKFGLSTDQVQRQEEARGAVAAQPPSVTRVQTRVLQVSGSSAGRALFTLENGQTWRQTEIQSSFSLRPGDQVTLSKGALGSFWISTGPHNSARVERVH
jgi:hypothetical protein